MRIRTHTAALAFAACHTLVIAAPVRADDAKPSTANPVPVTRLDLKQALEKSKTSEPRCPLPPLTAEEKEKADKGDWSVVNNGRIASITCRPNSCAGSPASPTRTCRWATRSRPRSSGSSRGATMDVIALATRRASSPPRA